MAVRTAYDAVAGTALTATNLDKYPGGWIGYAERTTAQSSITTIADITSLSVTVTAGTSRRLRIEGYGRGVQTSATGLQEVHIRDGSSTTLTRTTVGVTTTTGQAMHQPVAVQTPSSGSNTYKLSAAVDAGALQFFADSSSPAFILVEDIGPAS